MRVELAVEGIVDEAVARAMLRQCGHEIGTIRGRRGKGWIDKNAVALRAASDTILIIRDLDHDADCAAKLKRALRATDRQGFLFRIAVRKIESWILADSAGLAAFLRVPEAAIPLNADELSDPKAVLFGLGSKPHGARKTIMFRDEGDYTSRIIEFVSNRWSAERASESRRSQSLVRALNRLRELKRDP
jgi:hypothetical protein